MSIKRQSSDNQSRINYALCCKPHMASISNGNIIFVQPDVNSYIPSEVITLMVMYESQSQDQVNSAISQLSEKLNIDLNELRGTLSVNNNHVAGFVIHTQSLRDCLGDDAILFQVLFIPGVQLWITLSYCEYNEYWGQNLLEFIQSYGITTKPSLIESQNIESNPIEPNPIDQNLTDQNLTEPLSNLIGDSRYIVLCGRPVNELVTLVRELFEASRFKLGMNVTNMTDNPVLGFIIDDNGYSISDIESITSSVSSDRIVFVSPLSREEFITQHEAFLTYSVSPLNVIVVTSEVDALRRHRFSTF